MIPCFAAKLFAAWSTQIGTDDNFGNWKIKNVSTYDKSFIFGTYLPTTQQ